MDMLLSDQNLHEKREICEKKKKLEQPWHPEFCLPASQ